MSLCRTYVCEPLQSLACLLIAALAAERDHKSKFYAEGAIPMLQSLVVSENAHAPERGQPSSTSSRYAQVALEQLGAEVPRTGFHEPTPTAVGITGE